jgi:LacI family transcriptional regulator, galactose operon repressor
MPLADRLSPALTTVRVQHQKGGLESAELLMEMMRGQGVRPRHIVLPVEIVIRGSTRRNPQEAGRRSRGENLMTA